ncbi:MAG: P-type conjugative transfer protein TrbG [Deltaproteobacteria bacterium]|nr:P-type conjugative transfer protein TrbG [Deltaproteobacteria bacterium]
MFFSSELLADASGPSREKLNLVIDPSLNEKPLTTKEAEALRLSREFDDRPINPIRGQDGKVIYVHGASMPIIVGSPMKITDVELEQGESVNEILVGDSARWLIESGTSGANLTHIFIKPIDVGLDTSLVVTTNKRVYHMRLVSRAVGYTPYVGFVYASQLEPVLKKEALETQWRTALVDGGEPVDMSNLNFHYTVKGKADWKPVMVYDNGLKMYIRLPDGARRSEIPILLVKQGKENSLVNYRLKYNTFEVDGLFDHVILVTGVGRKQSIVNITRDRKIATVARD